MNDVHQKDFYVKLLFVLVLGFTMESNAPSIKKSTAGKLPKGVSPDAAMIALIGLILSIMLKNKKVK